MKKRILSLVLSLALLIGCFSGLPVIAAEDAGSDFDPAEHLIEGNKSYQIISLDGKLTMNLFVDANSSQWNYSVDGLDLTEVIKTFIKGNANESEDGKITVSDILAVKGYIMDGYTDQQLAISDVSNDGKITVTDILNIKDAIMNSTDLGTVDVVVGSQSEELTWVETSTLGLRMGGVNYFDARSTVKDVEVEEIDRTYQHMGNQSELHDNCVAVTVTFAKGNYEYYLEARVYNDGIAFRYNMPGEGNRVVNEELTTFSLRKDLDEAWYGVNSKDYESRIEVRDLNAENTSDKINVPMTAVVSNGEGYISIQEAGVGDVYGGTFISALGNKTYKVGNTWDNGRLNKDHTYAGAFETGWRLVNVAKDLNGLVNNYNVFHVNDEPDEELYGDVFEWAEPGRSAWSWLTDYGATLKTPDAMYDYTMAAARLGFEYNVVDEGYMQPGWGADYRDDLASIGRYGEELGVKQILWAWVSGSHNGFQLTTPEIAAESLDFMKANGYYGVKLDFWWSEEESRTNSLIHEVSKLAAEREIIVNFHGAPKPGGRTTTYPNELTCEAIHGFEQYGGAARTDYPTYANVLSKQLFTRYLSGHADWTPACDTAMQIATLICIDSPLNVICTEPNRILANPAVELIKAIPTVWDETVVLSNSKIGDTAVYAKNTGDTWFLGGIYANAKQDKVDLGEFLGEGTYTMELWTDYIENGATKKEKTVTEVTADTILEFDIAAGGGYAARISKMSLNQYGGEIYQPIEITTVSDDSVVKYTTDGSDPFTSKTAKTYTEPVTLPGSCDFKAAIVDGDGEGTYIKAGFNAITSPYLEELLTYEDGKTTVAFKYNTANGTVKYTTDGSDPLTSATAKTYTKALELTEITTVKAAVITDGKDPVTAEFGVYINLTEVEKPDVNIGADYTRKLMGWGDVVIDKTMADASATGGATAMAILGGTSADTATPYAKTISCNAISTLWYNVPENATHLVGVVGIDSWNYNHASGAAASGTLQVLFDGKEVVTTPVFRVGDAYKIKVAIPEGAKEMTLIFGDAGDGITCDNIVFADSGWLIAD